MLLACRLAANFVTLLFCGGGWLRARKDVFSGWLGVVLGCYGGGDRDGGDDIWP